MSGCVLHVVGPDFDPHLALTGLKLLPYSIFKRGDPRFPGASRDCRPHETSGFKCIVSDLDCTLEQQVADAIAFLKTFDADLRQIALSPGVESMTLDFGYNIRIDGGKCAIQGDTLPPELLKLCGSLGLGIELSLYPAATETSSVSER